MVQRIAMAPQGPVFSRFVMGYWRLMDWKMSPGELVSFIEQHLDLGVTTVDHADIYGDYQCEAAFGEALKRAPHLRSRMEIVSKCGIATRARAENTIGHYITDRDHIVLSAEQSLRNGDGPSRLAADPPAGPTDGRRRGSRSFSRAAS